MPIPRIIHQLWKTDDIPARWRSAVASVRRYHPGWEYRLWTDPEIDRYVREKHPDFHPIFAGFERGIMRADVFRYILMSDLGGLYCDLDFEFLRPYEHDGAEVILSHEFSIAYGDEINQIANYVFASAPGHPLWGDLLAELKANPPSTSTYLDVVAATGPVFLTRVFGSHAYQGVRITEKPVFSPQRLHIAAERKILRNSGVTYGFHWGSGSWKERLTPTYARKKLAKLFR